MTFEIKLIEGMHRGFLSNYLTILTSFRTLEKKGIDLNKVCVSPSMFMLYGNPSNWFDESKISDDALKAFNAQDGWDCDYPWASFNDFDLNKYRKYLPYNQRIQTIIDNISSQKYSNCLGVHYRGTDGIGHTEFVSIQSYIDAADKEFVDGNYDTIFIATDQSDVIKKFLTHFKDNHNFDNILYYDHQRTMSKSGLHYSIEAQPNEPARVLAGDEVLIDAHTLSQCKTIIGKSSNITNYARILNPYLEILYQDLHSKNEHGDHADFDTRGYIERFPQLRVKDIQPFIFNWRNQFEKTCEIEDSLKKVFDEVIVINSDDNNTRPGWIDLGDSAYFSDQFRKALELFSDDKKVLLHIQGDVKYDNWEELIKSSRKYYNLYEWGIYAPNVDYTWYSAENADIDGIESGDSNIKMCACTDETVWFIHRDVIEEFYNKKILENFSENKMGWGWDLAFCGLSFLMGRSVIRDYNHTIDHPPGTNYNKEVASKEMGELWRNLPEDLSECITYIKGDREKLIKYFE